MNITAFKLFDFIKKPKAVRSFEKGEKSFRAATDFLFSGFISKSSISWSSSALLLVSLQNFFYIYFERNRTHKYLELEGTAWFFALS